MNQTPTKEVITSKDFYSKDDGESYNAISDYIHDHLYRVPLDEMSDVPVDVDLSDCYLLSGALFVPTGYKTTYKGSNFTDDPDEVEPTYDSDPTLTEDEVQQLVDIHNCEHQCTSNCRREGCKCRCGEFHVSQFIKHF